MQGVTRVLAVGAAATAAAAVGAAVGAVLLVQYRVRNFPPAARRHLRRALLADNYSLYTYDALDPRAPHDPHDASNSTKTSQGTTLLPAVEYQAAFDATLRAGRPCASREASGILQFLADFHRRTGNRVAMRDSLHLLFRCVSLPPVLPNESASDSASASASHAPESDRDRTDRLKTALKAAQWCAEAAQDAHDTDEARFYYEWIVQHSIVPPPANQQSASQSQSQPQSQSHPIVIQPFASVRQTGSALEQLGKIYSDMNRVDWALHAYKRALDLVFKDKDLQPVEQQCQSAILHNNMAECLSRLESEPAALAQSLQLTQIALNTIGSADPVARCGECEPVVLYNMAAILSKMGRKADADKHWRMSLARSKLIGFTNGIDRAQTALRTSE